MPAPERDTPQDYPAEAYPFFGVIAITQLHEQANANLRIQLAAKDLELAELRRAADIDKMTGLLNKEAWKRELQSKIEADRPFGIVFIDLDAFKRVNDDLGHERGDELLADFGAMLTNGFRRENDVLTHERTVSLNGGRYGGDEFGIIFDLDQNAKRGGDPAERFDKQLTYLDEILEDFVASQPEEIRRLNFNISVGPAMYDPSRPVYASTLLKQADEAMYEQKATNKLALE